MTYTTRPRSPRAPRAIHDASPPRWCSSRCSGSRCLIWWYASQQRRRARAASAFVAPALSPSVAPRRPRWRRHVPMLVFVIALAVLIVAAARPQRSVAEPVTDGAIMLGDDVVAARCRRPTSRRRVQGAAQRAARALRGERSERGPGRAARVRPDADRAAVADDRSRAHPGGARAPRADERRHRGRRRDPDRDARAAQRSAGRRQAPAGRDRADLRRRLERRPRAR